MLLAAELEGAADEDENAAGRAGWLAVDGGDGVGALLEGEGGELGGNGGRPLDLGALEGEHGAVLVKPAERRPVAVERLVVVVHKRLRYPVLIHRCRERSNPSLIL